MRLKVLELVLNYGTFLVKGDLNLPETREKLTTLYTALQLSGEENKTIRKEFIDYMARFLSTKRLYELNKFYVDIELKHNDQQFYRNPNIASGLLKVLVERVTVKNGENLVIPALIKKLYKEVMIDALDSIYHKTGQEQINQVVNHLTFCALGHAPIVKQSVTKIAPSDNTSEAILQAETINRQHEEIRAQEELKAKAFYKSIFNFSDDYELSDHAEDYQDKNTLKFVPDFNIELEKEFINCVQKITVLLASKKADETTYIEKKTEIKPNKEIFSNVWNKFKAKVFDHGKIAENDYFLLREQIQSIPSLIADLAETTENQLSAYFALFIVIKQLLQQLIVKISSSRFENELEKPMQLACELAEKVIQSQERYWKEHYKMLIKYGVINDNPTNRFINELKAKVETRQKQIAEQPIVSSNSNQQNENFILSKESNEIVLENETDSAEFFRTKGVPMRYGSPGALKKASSLRNITLPEARLQSEQSDSLQRAPAEKTSAEEFRKSGLPGSYIDSSEFNRLSLKGSIKPSDIKADRLSTEVTTKSAVAQPQLGLNIEDKTKFIETSTVKAQQDKLPEIFDTVLSSGKNASAATTAIQSNRHSNELDKPHSAAANSYDQTNLVKNFELK